MPSPPSLFKQLPSSPELLVRLSGLPIPGTDSGCCYQEEEACEVGEFRTNMTVTAGRLLRLSCPLASSPACLLATTRVQWQWAPAQDQPRTAVTSQFDNPPYFYLLVLDFTLFPSLNFFRECCQVSLVGTGACWEKEKQVLQ